MPISVYKKKNNKWSNKMKKRTKKTDIYENKFGRFYIIDNDLDTKSHGWVARWFSAGSIRTYPEGEFFRTKRDAVNWIKTLAATRALHEKDLPIDGTWTDDSITYEYHGLFDTKF